MSTSGTEAAATIAVLAPATILSAETPVVSVSARLGAVPTAPTANSRIASYSGTAPSLASLVARGGSIVQGWVAAARSAGPAEGGNCRRRNSLWAEAVTAEQVQGGGQNSWMEELLPTMPLKTPRMQLML